MKDTNIMSSKPRNDRLLAYDYALEIAHAYGGDEEVAKVRKLFKKKGSPQTR